MAVRARQAVPRGFDAAVRDHAHPPDAFREGAVCVVIDEVEEELFVRQPVAVLFMIRVQRLHARGERRSHEVQVVRIEARYLRDAAVAASAVPLRVVELELLWQPAACVTGPITPCVLCN